MSTGDGAASGAIYLFRCPRCGGETMRNTPSGAFLCGQLKVEGGSCGTVTKRVYSTGIGTVDGAGGSPGRSS